MNRIDEEEEEDDNADISTITSPVDQFSSIQPSPEYTSNSIYSSKQTSNKYDRSKYQTANRPTSLSPQRHFPSSHDNFVRDVKQRRRYASDSNTSSLKNIPTSLVTSFLRHLRHELRATTTNTKNDYHHPTRQRSSERTNSLSPDTSDPTTMNSDLSNENSLDNNNDTNEILTLIDLLVLRVECLSNERRLSAKKRRQENCPTVAEVDQNLIEYLYYLFTKFVNDESNSSIDIIPSMIDKNSFVNVCQILVRNGCFDIPTTATTATETCSPDQSVSETTSSSENTLTQQVLVPEYQPDEEKLSGEKSSTDEEIHSAASNEQDTWLVVDLEGTQSEEEMTTSDVMYQLPSSISDEQLLINNDNYNSFESGSSPSVYLSPNSSLVDLQNMVQEYDELHSPSHVPNNEDGSSSKVITDTKTTLSNDNTPLNNDIYQRLTHVESSIENSEQISIDKMSRREKKMQERWSISTNSDKNSQDQSPSKALLTVDFPPIAVLRRKFSSSPTDKKEKNNTDEKSDSNSSTTIEEINTSPTAILLNQTNPDQTAELSSEDLSLLISPEIDKTNDEKQLPVTVSEVICLSDEEITTSKTQGLPEYQTEPRTNLNNEFIDYPATNEENSSETITNPSDSSSMASFPSSSPLISISSPSYLTLTTDENKTIEPLSKETDEGKKEEEQQRCNVDYNVDEEKKNTSSFEHDNHASGILLINDDPTQTALLHQEKKEKEEEQEEEEEEEEERERPSSPLPTLEQFNQQRTEDESPVQTLSNHLKRMAMTNIDEAEERYKKVEIEDIPEDDDEAVSTQNIESTEPTDYIHIDDEPIKSKQSNVTTTSTSTTNDEPLKFDNVFSCYEKALAKVVDTYESSEPSSISTKESSITTEQAADDPIALRALQRFEERMNAAAAKTSKDEMNTLAAKGKSPWAASLSTSRKSLDNILKEEEQQLRPTSITFGGDESKSLVSSSLTDSYIRPRKTFDDTNLNYGVTLNLFGISNSPMNKSNIDDYKLEKSQELSALVDNNDERVVDNTSLMNMDLKDQQEQQQQISDDTIHMNGSNGVNEAENSTIEQLISTDDSRISSSFDTAVSQSSSSEQQAFKPYHFQLEGRRRLNGVERMRERQSRESLNTSDLQQQLQNDYTLKPEEIQDPIIRRALERFDEKSRSLAQTKSVNYDDIQDPITRRALMRLESNLKRTNPPPLPPPDPHEKWYTESYTLGSLQPANNRVSRYTDSSQSPTLNNKAKHISVHQRYCAPSSTETADLSTTNNFNSTHEEHIPVMHVPSQPIYLTSNHLQQQQQQQQQPLSLRQRSRSEDMLSSRDLTIGQTTNLDDIDTTTQLQRNRSSNQIAINDPGYHLPNTLMKALDPTFVRTTESAVSYTTPTQTYSAYSCEYTRPRRNVGLTTSETPTMYQSESNQLPPPKYSQQNDIQRPNPYRPSMENEYQSQTTSAFAPIRSSTATTTGGYYSQEPLPIPSYGSMYVSNNHNPTPYSEDPIIRRALERFNSQMQNSLLSTSQYQSPNNYSSHQGTFPDNHINSNRPPLMTTSTSSHNNIGGYQSIIGRRRQRNDEPNTPFMDNSNIGDGYSSSVFNRSHSPYSMSNQYMNMPDEPPAVPPRFRRTEDLNDQYRRHSIDEYLAENMNNNNNNTSHTLPRDAFLHHAYPATITNSSGFRPINNHYNQSSAEHDDLYDPTQLPMSNNSSDNLKQQRLMRPDNLRPPINHQERSLAPSVMTRTNGQSNGRKATDQIISNKLSSDNLHTLQDQTIQNNGNVPGDSVFHRLAYTGTKASLSRSSSNSCSNLLNKTSPQIPTSQLKSCEIDFDETSNATTTATLETSDTNEQIPTFMNKCQRSKSVDGRARLKIIQARTPSNMNPTILDNDENDVPIQDEEPKSVPSSKFTPINGRRDVPPPRVPLTPSSTYRTSSLKRPTNGNNLTYTKDNYGFRTQNSNGNLHESDNQQQDTENDENISYSDDNYQPKLMENRTRTAIPVHRYTTNNTYIQTSPSTSSVTSVMSRTKVPPSVPINIERRDSNTMADMNRIQKRLDDHHRPSPSTQRRNVPVSVFSPAKLDIKRPAPAPPTTTPAHSYESQPQTSYSARLPTHDNSYMNKITEHEMNTKSSTTKPDRKTPTGNLINEFTLTTDKHDTNTNNKKMNVFERLFRGNKKKN